MTYMVTGGFPGSDVSHLNYLFLVLIAHNFSAALHFKLSDHDITPSWTSHSPRSHHSVKNGGGGSLESDTW